jgi:DNA-binding response OmpR family regulator
MKKHILIIHKNGLIREAIQAHLEASECDVMATENPHVGCEHALFYGCDLLLVDADIPFLSGEVLLLCMGINRSNCKLKVVPPKIILFSADLTGKELEKRCAALKGASYFEITSDMDGISLQIEPLLDVSMKPSLAAVAC